MTETTDVVQEAPVATENESPIIVVEDEQNKPLMLSDLRIIARLSQPEPVEDESLIATAELVMAKIKEFGYDPQWIEEASVVVTTGEIAADKRAEIMAALELLPGVSSVEDEQASYFTGLRDLLTRTYQHQDSIFVVVTHPRDLELFQTKLAEMAPPELTAAIQFKTDPDCDGLPQIALRSQVETQWVTDHFNRLGLFKYLQAKGSPIIPNGQELKFLYLLQALLEVQEKTPKIVTPGGVDSLRLR